MNKLQGFVLCVSAGTFLFGCGKLSQPVVATPTSATPAGVVALPAEPAQTVQVKAGVGSGKKGRSLDKHEGIIVTPAKTLFAAKEKIKFEIEIPKALQLFDALEGRGPSTHEEFMEKVIKAYNVELPELPEGHRYLYDPMTKTLMVEKPAP
ncbi:MAG: hypothetical protein ACR2FY_19620 [Pirellulaceae bacterium]